MRRMQNLVQPMLVVAAMVVMVGCGSSSGGAAPATAPSTSRPPTPAEAAGQIKAGDSAACQTNYATLRTAIDVYGASNGSDPTSVSDLIPDFLRQGPVEWTIKPSPDGTATIVATPAGTKAGCVAPKAGS